VTVTTSAADEERVLAQGAMLLPQMVAGSGPFPKHQARWINAQGLSAAQRQVVSSLYLAMMTATCLGLVGAQGPVILEGPFGANATYLRMLSAATGAPVHLGGETSTGTTLGAAMLCATRPPDTPEPVVVYEQDPALQAYARNWIAAAAQG
jgi:sugar (pentulose or hexulose) kinase